MDEGGWLEGREWLTWLLLEGVLGCRHLGSFARSLRAVCLGVDVLKGCQSVELCQ